MIDHVYVVITANDFGEVDVQVHEHRVSAIFEAVATAMLEDYHAVCIPVDIQLQGLDLVFKAKHGPAHVSVVRRVPK